MFRHGIPLGRVLGIPVILDFSWFLIFGLLTWSLAVSYFPNEYKGWSPWVYWTTGAAASILLFLSVLLHELGHSVIAKSYRIPVRKITLFIFGGVAEIGAEPPSARAEFLIAIAGPIVSLLLAVGFQLSKHSLSVAAPLLALVTYLAYINFALVLFNAIPGFPLDGGRVFRAIVWAVTGNFRRATLIAAYTGRFFGFLFIFAGVWQFFNGNAGGGLWIAFIGWFLESAAGAQVQQTMLRSVLTGHTVSQAMNRHYATVPADLTLEQLVDEHVLGAGSRAFVVMQADEAVGLMTLRRLKEIPRSNWSTTTASQAMIPLDQLKKLDPKTEIWDAMLLMDRDGVNQLPVSVDGRITGMLSREDVLSALRTLQEIGQS